MKAESKNPHPLDFRRATLADAPLLLEWRNDPQTRKNSISEEVITEEQHLSWLRLRINSSSCQIWLALWSSKPVGTVRYQQTREKTWELSWTVAPDFRGQGLGSQLVTWATQNFPHSLQAKIKASNPASIKVAQRAGYQLQNEDPEGLQTWISPKK